MDSIMNKKTPAKQAPKKILAGTSQTEAAHKRALFIAAFRANGGNQTQAAVSAGFSEKTAGMAGCRLMAREDVRQAIADADKKVLQDLDVTNEKIIAEYAKMAFLDPRSFFDAEGNLIAISMLPASIAAAVAGMSVESVPGGSSRMAKIKFSDKLKALDSLARISGMFKDTVKVEVVTYAEKLQKARERITRNR